MTSFSCLEVVVDVVGAEVMRANDAVRSMLALLACLIAFGESADRHHRDGPGGDCLCERLLIRVRSSR